MDEERDNEDDSTANPRTADDGEAVSGFPEPPGTDPGDISEADLGEPPERDNLDD